MSKVCATFHFPIDHIFLHCIFQNFKKYLLYGLSQEMDHISLAQRAEEIHFGNRIFGNIASAPNNPKVPSK